MAFIALGSQYLAMTVPKVSQGLPEVEIIQHRPGLLKRAPAIPEMQEEI
jgi:hypothetical protein